MINQLSISYTWWFPSLLLLLRFLIFQQFDYDVSKGIFLWVYLFEVYWASQPNFGGFQSLFLQILFLHCPLFSPGTPVKWILDFLFLSHFSLRFCLYIFFSLLPLCCIHWILSINLSSSSLTASSYLNPITPIHRIFIIYYYSYWLFSVLKFLFRYLYLLFLC